MRNLNEVIMTGFLKNNIVLPLFGRIGTAVSVWLLSQGVQAQMVDTIVAGLLAVGMVGSELVLSFYARKRAVARGTP